MSDLLEAMNDAGINVSRYKRGPLGKDSFAAGIIRSGPEGLIKVWEGGEENEIHFATSDEYRQAVVNVIEPTRRIELSVEGFLNSHKKKPRKDEIEQALLRERDRLAASGALAKVIEGHIVPDGSWQYSGSGIWKHTVKGKIRWTIPRSTQTMLMGMDETYHFIAALREPAKSVAEAHRKLRPEGVTKNTLRQGEWFFVPVSKKIQEALDEIVEENPRRLSSANLGNMVGSHSVFQRIIYNKKTYAIGYVVDRRKGHHSPVWLPTWHEVIRNNEIVQRSSGVTRYWD